MHPENQGGAGRRAGRKVLQIVIASVFAAALALLAFYIWQLDSRLTALQYSLDSAAEWLDTMQGPEERPNPVFSVASFKLDYKKDEYGETYSGSVIIACDQLDPCVAILRTTLVSGGSAYTDAVSYSLIIVQNGIGKYSTYDWGELGKLEKPQYEFEVVGYLQTSH